MYRRILVPVDGSPTSLKGLEEAIKLARVLGATIKLVHVVNAVMDSSFGPGLYYGDVVMDLRAAGERALADASTYVRAEGVPVERDLIETSGVGVAGTIVEAAKQWNADLIAMGTHGHRGLRRLALGSDAELVLRSVSVPVLMVRDPAPGT
jgi:nucleotide-binding universal stress UspA family protein